MPTSSSNISSNIDRNKRIASNTIVLFVRMFVLMIINLYTVRIVLNRLGDIDYGIYNAVAGVVTATAFISGVLALSIQRFYSIALVKGDYITLHKIFSASINIVIGVTIVLLIIFETVGIWFIKSHMTIPIDRLEPAIVLFQFALFTFFLYIIQIHYTAELFTHESQAETVKNGGVAGGQNVLEKEVGLESAQDGGGWDGQAYNQQGAPNDAMTTADNQGGVSN